MIEQSDDQVTKRQVSLRLLATSDVHATLMDYDYAKDHRTLNGSLARAATKIAELRADGNATLLFDNGDFLQGAAIAGGEGEAPPIAKKNPVIAAMNHLAYDAVGLGNHEFNLPAEDLQGILKQAKFPILCANLHISTVSDSAVYDALWQPSILLRVSSEDQFGTPHNLCVGVISVLPPQVVSWDKLRIKGRLRGEDMSVAVRRQVTRLQQRGVDVIVVLAHSGISEHEGHGSAENVALRLSELDGVSAVVCGHVHRVFPGPSYASQKGIDPVNGTLSGKPAVMPGAHGSHLGQIDLTLVKQAARWEVIDAQSKVHALGGMDPIPEDDAMCAVVESSHVATIARMRRKLGHLPWPVTSYFAMVEDDHASRLVAEAKVAFVREAIAGTALAAYPVLASVAPLKCGGRAGPAHYVDVPSGEMSARVVEDIQPYSNHICLYDVSGSHVMEWLEKGFSVYNQMRVGVQGQFLHDRDAPTYNREAIYGLSYLVDLSQPARYGLDGEVSNPQARRIADVTWRGAPIAPDQRFLLATNDYRGGGGGNFPMIQTADEIDVGSASVRDILEQHIARTTAEQEQKLDTWKMKSLANTTAFFETGPGAGAYLKRGGMPIDRVGPAVGGFERYQLRFSEFG
ncbi:bifunctional 2',3'-cyclic-nucleotide 2'-phosphodiesterase/3'-nucleotidase [Shimia sp.]|uniref:bifunctional 2',3'-cyclic-nucleotide 2'-phosphodiesterase/3'-nucleotidase n=1 Tax=Shimia sp. TaxID=1954381 RepID=UPI003B8D4A79